MFALGVKSLVQDGIPLRSEGVMIVSERLHRKETEPFIQLPYWDQDAEKLVMMEISEKQLKGVSYGMNVVILNVNWNPAVKSKPPSSRCAKLSNCLRFKKESKQSENKIVIILREKEQMLKLFEVLPPEIRPQETDAYSFTMFMVNEVPIDADEKSHILNLPLPDFFTYNVSEIKIPGAMMKLDDCVEQYFGFLSFLKRHNIETTLRQFKKHLNRNGNNIYSFLKIQVRFTGINSLSDTLTKYIKSSKCYNQKCPIFTRTKCSKCKTAVYCSEACQNKDWKIHRQNCEVLRIDKVNRIDVFQNLITEIAASKLKSAVNFLTFKDFFDRIRPFAFRGYYDFILKETFLLGAIKFSSEKFSSIDIDEDTQTLAPLLKSSRSTWIEGFRKRRGDILGVIMEERGRDWFFHEQILMKKLFTRGELDTAKIQSDEWIDDFNSRDEDFRLQFNFV